MCISPDIILKKGWYFKGDVDGNAYAVSVTGEVCVMW